MTTRLSHPSRQLMGSTTRTTRARLSGLRQKPSLLHPAWREIESLPSDHLQDSFLLLQSIFPLIP